MSLIGYLQMLRLLRRVCFFASPLLLLSNALTVWAESVDISFNRDIRPLLADRCFHCHGPDEEDRQADLRLDLVDPDGRTVEVLSPGSVDRSEVIKRLTATDPDQVMPPPDSHKKPLTESEVALFRQWVEQGAEYEEYWAFSRIVKPAVPSVALLDWCANPIDFFVVRKLEKFGLEPKPAADRRTLIRRLSFDLTGLPPTPAEIRKFLQDESPQAYESLVDRLLESSGFGEHMARYWLDLVRFADTNGIHHDHYRDLSPYRQWVIESFNQNLPYDQFVRDQLAGDLLEEPETDQLIASGFNRLHMIIDRGTMLPEESLARNVIDRVTSVGTAFMGLTVGCAVCHDHKYDPITSREFYQLYAFFNNLDAAPETGGRSGTDFRRGLQAPFIELPTLDQQERLAAIDSQLQGIGEESTELKAWLEKANSKSVKDGDEAQRESRKNQDDNGAQKTPDTVTEPQASTEENAERDTKEKRVKELDEKKKKLAAAREALIMEVPAAMVMRERVERRPSNVMIRGAYDNLGEEVQRDTPAFLPPMQIADDKVASRLDLATWLTSPEHPLTSRVTINRFWQQLFGVGIVKTSEDLGAQGEWPSHPELLDYLASEFIDSGWNVKSLMKLMVMSKTYRQQTNASPEEFERDPDNRLLARGSRYRLDAEVIRDQMLSASGLLKRSIGGKSVKPPQPDGLWKSVALPSSFPNRFVADQGDEKIYRRSLYTFWKRGLPPPQMTILNAPAREECVARRERTNTPLQALLLMNEQQALDAARHLARRITEEKPDKPFAYLYETVTGQLPDESESALLEQAFSDFEAHYSKQPDLAKQLVSTVLQDGQSAPRLAAWTMLVNSVFNLDIVKTRP